MAVQEVFAEATRVEKNFGTSVALKGASLSCRSGEIHALVGENGAGKSTLAGIFSGFIRPDAGVVTLFGKRISPTAFKTWSPARAIGLGVAMVYQRSMLIPQLTVTENIAFSTKGFRYDESHFKSKVEALALDFKLDVPTDCKVADLSAGDRQRAELIRSLIRGGRFLILDEPTSVLTPREADSLFGVLKSLRDRGCSILFISHKLDEVIKVADRITVIRRGNTISTHLQGSVSAADLAAMAIGSDDFQTRVSTARTEGLTKIKLDGLFAAGATARSVLSDINLEIRSGELVGIAGVEGNGQKELEEVFVGIRPVLKGRFIVENNELLPTIRTHRSAGVSILSGNKLMGGLIGELTIAENLVLKGSYDDQRFFSRWRMKHEPIDRYAREVIERCAIRPANPSASVLSLSGGNAQKVSVAREIESATSGLLAFQPTRGLDKSAADAVHRQLLELRQAGKAVLVVSADLDELLKLSARFFVMRSGRLLACEKNASKESVGSLMLSGETK
ncbi:ATP-binding cassette domain-containing protein [Myxococcota bacterium]|nr:ATP-binding cassette domain-containing protein [Myxococcota bacterium]